MWPGIKLIHGVAAGPDDPEFGISRGCLLPRHNVFTEREMSSETRQRLQQSLVLVHGGMAQDVGPDPRNGDRKIPAALEVEWAGRQEAMRIFDDAVAALDAGDIRAVGACTQRNFDGPIQTIIPWAGNLYTDLLVRRVRSEMGEDFWGFWMLGGMSGGGMGFLFDPRRKAEAQDRMRTAMSETKRSLEGAAPFAMEPVVYDFRINECGSHAALRQAGARSCLPVITS